MNLVSIIIPTYNRAGLIHKTLNSVIEQTYKNWECIIVDDGSTDNSLSILKDYQAKDSRFKVLNRPDSLKKGAPSCRNYGFKNANGSFIQWFDSDDLMEPFMLEKKVEALIGNPGADFVVSKMSEQTPNGIIYPQYNLDSKNRVYDYLAYNIYFLTPGPMFRKTYLNNKKLFLEGLPRYQEWEFYSRLVVDGCSYKAIDEFHCIRTMHDDSIRTLSESGFDFLKKNYFKFLAVQSVNTGTKNKAIGAINKIFNRRLLSSIKYALLNFKINYLIFFTILYFELKIKLLITVLTNKERI